MATKYWTGGAGDGNWATAGNWDTSGAPSGTDTIIFDRDVGPPTSGLAQGALTPAVFTITPAFKSSITGLVLGNTTTATIAGTGSSYQIQFGAVTTLAIETPTGVSVTIPSGGTITTLNVSGATVDCQTVVTTLNNGQTGIVDLSASGTAVTTIDNAGRVTCRRNVTTLRCQGTDSQTVTLGSVTVTTGEMNGWCNWNHRSSGTITTLNARPKGTFSVAGAPGNPTITTLNEWGGSKLILVTPGVAASVGTRNQVAVVSETTPADGIGEL